MRRFLCACLIFILCASLWVSPALAAEEPDIQAEAVILADMDTGQVLYESHADDIRAPASLTKIMTVLLAVEAIERGEVSAEEYVTAGSDCLEGLDGDSSSAGIRPGEQLRLIDLLYCAMLPSGNEACNIIASRLGGSMDAFCRLMNTRAAELGCTGTCFCNPNGLSVTGHYSTARDMLYIAREAMSHELFAQICGTGTYDVPATNLSEARHLENSNALLNAASMYGDYSYPGTLGIKTGYTWEAGYCLASAAEREDIRLMAIVLGCEGGSELGYYGNFSESVKLYDWAFENYERRQIVSASQCLWEGKIDGGRGTLSLCARDELSLLLPKNAQTPIPELAVDIEALSAPIPADSVLGEVSVRYDGTTVSTALVSQTEVKRSLFAVLADFVSGTAFLVMLLIFLLAALVFLLCHKSGVRGNKRRRKATVPAQSRGGGHLKR